MKRVLIVKTSSLGDIVHTLPALTDAVAALGDISFDWVAEENFSQIPAWHPAVKQVIPVALRRWRKAILKAYASGQWKQFKSQLQTHEYDAVIDAQGLLKSAWITSLARGQSYGFDKQSAREPLAARFYNQPQRVAKNLHAVERVRKLFSLSLGYEIQDKVSDYGIIESLSRQQNNLHDQNRKRILLFHGTTWETKHWPEIYWCRLAEKLAAEDYSVLLPWGDETERQRAIRIQQFNGGKNVSVLEKMDLNGMVNTLLGVSAVVAVDTGLAHLSAALDKPTIALYGSTNPGLTGTYGKNQLQLQVNYECAPCLQKRCNKPAIADNYSTSVVIKPGCYVSLSPEKVYQQLVTLLQ